MLVQICEIWKQLRRWIVGVERTQKASKGLLELCLGLRASRWDPDLITKK